jgi:hypothetical protein
MHLKCTVERNSLKKGQLQRCICSRLIHLAKLAGYIVGCTLVTDNWYTSMELTAVQATIWKDKGLVGMLHNFEISSEKTKVF